jgi:hypothetical protein
MTKEIKTSRRTILCAGAAAVAAAGITTRATAQQKIEKSMVLYQDKPHEGQECDKCLQFLPPNACTLVAGEISPTGWCGAFAPKP